MKQVLFFVVLSFPLLEKVEETVTFPKLKVKNTVLRKVNTPQHYTVNCTDGTPYFKHDISRFSCPLWSAQDLTGSTAGTVTVKATETSATFTIQTLKDAFDEGIENFTFAATGYRYAGEGEEDNDLGFLLIKNAGTGTIIDEEYDNTLKVEVSDQSVNEANTTMTFTVTLKGELKENEKLTVDFATYDDTATGEYDYAHVSKSVTFTKEAMSQTIEVPIYDDSYKECDERFFLAPHAYRDYQGDKTVELANAGVGTIIDNDKNGRIVIEVGSVSADEGDLTEAERYQGIARKKGIFIYNEKFRNDFWKRRAA